MKKYLQKEIIMLFKKILLFTLITSSTCNLYAASPHEIRTWGVMITSVIFASTGLHVLTRQHYNMSHRILDIGLGLALIAAGLYGIVLSDKVSTYLEHAFH
jgi:hypothetical protein